MKNRKPFSMFTMLLNSALWNLWDYPKPRAAGMSQGSADVPWAMSLIQTTRGLLFPVGTSGWPWGLRVGSQAQSQNGSVTWGLIFHWDPAAEMSCLLMKKETKMSLVVFKTICLCDFQQRMRRASLSLQGFYPAYSQFSFVFFMSILLQWINSSATILGLFVLKSSLFQRKCPWIKKTPNTDSYN